MGEISDALKRAKDEQGSREPAAPSRSRGEYSAVMDRDDRTETRPADAPGSRRKATGESDVESERAAPAPSRISRERGKNSQARTVLLDEHGAGAEAYRHFAVRVRRALQAQTLHSIMVVSALRMEGKTTTACNLALALSSLSSERTTALVDLDLRRPSVAPYLGTETGVGIESVLRGEASLEEVRVPTDFENLDVYPVARPISQPHELLYGHRFADAVRDLEKSYDTLVIDSPPVLMAPDVEIMAPHVGACVAVFNSRNTRCAAFQQMIDRLPEGKLLGSFINRTRRRQAKYYYGSYATEEPGEEAETET